MTDWDANRDTQTSAVLARFDEKGNLWDRRNIELLIKTLLDQRDWHQAENGLTQMVIDSFQDRLLKIMESKKND